MERSITLAEHFQSTVNLLYIIEEKTLNQTDKLSDAYRTCYDRTETKKEIIKEHIQTADKIIFDKAKSFYENKEIPSKVEIVEGEFSSVIQREIKKNNYDLILMGFEKECLLKYRLLDEVNIPIWIESGRPIRSFLAVCSNLAPNKRVPEFSLQFSKLFNWKLHMLYVVDIQDSVVVNEYGIRSERQPSLKLLDSAKEFQFDMHRHGINVEIVKGNLERETIKTAEKTGSELIIIGREKKRKNLLGLLPIKSVKRKVAEKTNFSYLFIN